MTKKTIKKRLAAIDHKLDELMQLLQDHHELLKGAMPEEESEPAEPEVVKLGPFKQEKGVLPVNPGT